MGKFLILILSVSALLRFGLWQFTPPELFGDEIDVGYQAYSLLNTGKDLSNNSLPFYLESLAESRLPILIYATVPSVWMFDLDKFSVRLPQMLFGTITPIILFCLVYALTKNKYYSSTSSLIISILPWHIHYSRSAFEVVLLLLFILVATYTWTTKRLLLSLVFFALSMYTYSTAILFVPIWMIVLFVKNSPGKFNYQLILKTLFFGLLLIPLLSSVISGQALGRFSNLSIFDERLHLDSILTSRANDSGQLSSLFYNRPESISRSIITNYFRSFSTDFLFIKGDPTMRHSWQYIGTVFPVFAPLLVAGIYFAIKNKLKFFVVWLLLAPIPSSLTADGAFHATRLFLMVAPISALIGIGSTELILILKQSKKGIAAIFVFLLLFITQAALAGNYYLNQYPKTSWIWWHTGYESIFKSLLKVESQYTRIAINNTYEPALIRYLFYTKYPPQKFHKLFTDEKPEAQILPAFDGFTIDNRVFIGNFSSNLESREFSMRLLPNTLYLVSQRDDVGGDWDWRKSPPDDVNVVATSTNPFDQPLLYLISKKTK